jgi:predicted transcriptional regulator/DNA-binding XRE family transcriptional regulator
MANTGREGARLGAKVKALRRQHGLSQAQLAERLKVSASYLNLIENSRRPLPAAMMIRLAELFSLDLARFATDEDTRTTADLLEALSDPLFEPYALHGSDVRELVTSAPALARAMLGLYRAYESATARVESLAATLSDGDESPGARTHAPSEEVNDLIQRRGNYFPALEEAAEDLWKRGRIDGDDLYGALKEHLREAHGVSVQVARWGDERGVLRRYDPERKRVVLSELLPTRSRNFQLAHQVALLSLHDELDRIVDEGELSSDESRALARVALANYFAGALVMPYKRFLEAARAERYDLDVLGRRFRVGFEQVAHRLTTLRRRGMEGVPFHMLRIDVAGNISKRFSGSGIRFARFSGACPRWNVFSAFQTPNMIRIQLSRMPDGESYFCIARTIQKDSGGFHQPQPTLAIGLGCRVEFARELVYSDGVALDRPDAATPVGVTCRLCERPDCEQRAVPSLRAPLRIDENVRGASLYSIRPEKIGPI